MGYNSGDYRAGRDDFARGALFDNSASDSWKAGYKHEQRRFSTGMMVDVITADRDPDAPPVRTNRINYNSERARAWLASHMRWALMNGHTVHLAGVQ